MTKSIKKTNLVLLITILLSVGVVSATTINGTGTSTFTTNIDATGYNITANKMIVSSFSNFYYNILVNWLNITDRPTHLSNLTDDLGDRGYNSLSNFTNDVGYVTNATMNKSVDCSNIDGATSNLCTLTDTDTTYTHLSNFTDDLGVFTDIGNFTGAKTDTKYCTWDSTSGTINCTSEGGGTDTVWAIDDVYLNNVSGTLTLNETKLNATIEALSDIDTDTVWTLDDVYLNNVSGILTLNETKLNATIQALDTGGHTHNQNLNTTNDVTFNDVTVTTDLVGGAGGGGRLMYGSSNSLGSGSTDNIALGDSITVGTDSIYNMLLGSYITVINDVDNCNALGSYIDCDAYDTTAVGHYLENDHDFSVVIGTGNGVSNKLTSLQSYGILLGVNNVDGLHINQTEVDIFIPLDLNSQDITGIDLIQATNWTNVTISESQISDLQAYFTHVDNFTGAKTDTKYCTWDNTAGTINCTSTPSGTGDITAVVTTSGLGYIYNGSDTGDVSLAFNETKLNATIDARATGVTDGTGGWTNVSNVTSTTHNINTTGYIFSKSGWRTADQLTGVISPDTSDDNILYLDTYDNNIIMGNYDTVPLDMSDIGASNIIVGYDNNVSSIDGNIVVGDDHVASGYGYSGIFGEEHTMNGGNNIIGGFSNEITNNAYDTIAVGSNVHMTSDYSAGFGNTITDIGIRYNFMLGESINTDTLSEYNWMFGGDIWLNDNNSFNYLSGYGITSTGDKAHGEGYNLDLLHDNTFLFGHGVSAVSELETQSANSFGVGFDQNVPTFIITKGKVKINGDLNVTTNISTPKICLNGDCQTSWPGGSDTVWTLDDVYLNNVSDVLTLNETKLNSTIESLDEDNQTLSFDGDNITISGGNSVNISSIDTDTQLSQSQVQDYINNSGYYNISINYSNILNHPSMTDTDTVWTIDDVYLNNVSDTLTFNETKLNATIDARSGGSGHTHNQDLNTTDNVTFNEVIISDALVQGGSVTYNYASDLVALGEGNTINSGAGSSNMIIGGWNILNSGSDYNAILGSSNTISTDVDTCHLVGEFIDCTATDGFAFGRNLQVDHNDAIVIGFGASGANQLPSTQGNSILMGVEDTPGMMIVVDNVYSYVPLTVTGAIKSTDWTNVTLTESQISDLQAYFTHVDNFTGAKTDTKYCTWDATGGTINCTSDAGGVDTVWTIDDIYLNNVSDTLTFNETKLNATIEALSDINTDEQTLSFSGGNITISNGNSINISSIDTDTTYTHLSNFTDDVGYYTSLDNFTTTLTDTYLCRYNNGGTEINCDVSPDTYSTGEHTTDTVWTLDDIYLNNVSGTLTLNETKLNSTITDLAGTDTKVKGDGTYLYNDSTTMYLNETVLNNTIDAKIAATVTDYNAATIQTLTGTADSGNVASIQSIDDSDSYNVSEATPGSPGFDVRINFTSVDEFNNVRLNTWYTGTSAHDVFIQLYNNDTSTWDTIGNINDGTDFHFQTISVGSDAQYIDSGLVQLRIYHDSNGVGTHDIYIDFVSLRFDTGSASITDHGQLGGLTDDDHDGIYYTESEVDAINTSMKSYVDSLDHTDLTQSEVQGYINNTGYYNISVNYSNVLNHPSADNPFDQTLNTTDEVKFTTVNITNAADHPAINIDQNGDTGDEPSTGGAINIDNTDNNGSALIIRTNYDGTSRQDQLVLIDVQNAGWDGPILRINSDSTDSEGQIRIDAPTPEIEFVETDQTTPYGKYELRLQDGFMTMNSRQNSDAGFEKMFVMLRTGSGGEVQMTHPLIGKIHDTGYARFSIFGLNPANTTHYFAISTNTTPENTADETGVPLGDIFLINGSGSVGIGTGSPSGKLDVNGSIVLSNGSFTSACTALATDDNGMIICDTDDTGGTGHTHDQDLNTTDTVNFTGLNIIGTTTAPIFLQTSGSGDPMITFNTTNSPNRINVYLDESETNNHLYIDGSGTGLIDTYLDLKAEDGENAVVAMYSGANRGLFTYSSGDILRFQNDKTGGADVAFAARNSTGSVVDYIRIDVSQEEIEINQADLNMTSNNITDVDCITFSSGGKICSGS